MPVGATASESSPGVYSLGHIHPGTPVLIRADGFVPTCRVAVANETIGVELDKGRHIEAILPESLPPAALRTVSLVGLDRAECPVAMFAFNPQFSLEPNGSWKVTFGSFPKVESVKVLRGGVTLEMIVPAGGGGIVLRPH